MMFCLNVEAAAAITVVPAVFKLQKHPQVFFLGNHTDQID